MRRNQKKNDLIIRQDGDHLSQDGTNDTCQCECDTCQNRYGIYNVPCDTCGSPCETFDMLYGACDRLSETKFTVDIV